MGCDREREEMNDDDGGRNLGRGQFLRAILDAPGVLSTRYLRHVLTHHGGRNGFNLVKSILADRPESPMHQPHERDDGRGFFAEELAGEYMNPTQAADVVLRFTSRTHNGANAHAVLSHLFGNDLILIKACMPPPPIRMATNSYGMVTIEIGQTFEAWDMHPRHEDPVVVARFSCMAREMLRFLPDKPDSLLARCF